MRRKTPRLRSPVKKPLDKYNRFRQRTLYRRLRRCLGRRCRCGGLRRLGRSRVETEKLFYPDGIRRILQNDALFVASELQDVLKIGKTPGLFLQYRFFVGVIEDRVRQNTLVSHFDDELTILDFRIGLGVEGILESFGSQRIIGALGSACLAQDDFFRTKKAERQQGEKER